MFFNLFSFSLLALSLPITALAGTHGNHLLNRHHEIAQRAPGNVDLFKRYDDARWSFYNAETGSQGSCGTWLSNSGFTVAVNQAQMNSGWCGQTITMTYNGKTTTAVIEDTCPGCPWGGLDLTPGLFSFFADQSIGIIYGTWNLGGDAAPPPPPPPPPPPAPPKTHKTTPAWTPPPAPSTSSTSAWAAPSSSSSPKPKASSSSSEAWSSKTSSSSSAKSSSATPAPTADTVSNLSSLYEAFVEIGGIIQSGATI